MTLIELLLKEKISMSDAPSVEFKWLQNKLFD